MSGTASRPVPAGEQAPLAAALDRAAELVAGLCREQLVELVEGRAELVYRPVFAALPAVPAGVLPPGAVPAARSGGPMVARSGPPVRSTGLPPAVDGPAPARRAFDVDAAVAEINALTSREDVARWLATRDRELTVPVLREVARRLGPTVSASASSKAGLKRNIVEGTAGFRERSAAMSGGGAWQR